MNILKIIYEYLQQLLGHVPPGTLQVTGVLGLALALIGYYQLRGSNRPNNNAASRPATGPSAGSQPPASSSMDQPASARGSEPRPRTSDISNTSVGRAVCARLASVKRVTISLPGVVLHEQDSAQLQESATVRKEAIEMVQEVVKVADTYLLAHVVDDVGQATVTGALEEAGLLGRGRGQLPPHRLLFCATPEGKCSIVRQIEPELHIDAAPSTVDDLQRFIPQLLHITPPGTKPAADAPNVGRAPSLTAFFST